MKKLIKMLVLFLSLVFILIFSGCEKEIVPVPVGEPTIYEFKIVDTLYVDGGINAILTVQYSTNAQVGVSNGHNYGGYLPAAGTFTYEVSTGELNQIVLTAVNSEDPFVFSRDTLNIVVDSVINPPTPTPTLVLHASPQTLEFPGGASTITWTVTNTDLVYFGEIGYEPNGSFRVNVTSDTILTFIAKGPGGQTSATISIDVEDEIIPPPPTVKEILCKFERKLVGRRYYLLEDPNNWFILENVTCELDDTYKYNLNNTCWANYGLILCSGETGQILTGTYTFSETEMLINDFQQITHIDDVGNLTIMYKSFRVNPDGISWEDTMMEETYAP